MQDKVRTFDVEGVRVKTRNGEWFSVSKKPRKRSPHLWLLAGIIAGFVVTEAAMALFSYERSIVSFFF